MILFVTSLLRRIAHPGHRALLVAIVAIGAVLMETSLPAVVRVVAGIVVVGALVLDLWSLVRGLRADELTHPVRLPLWIIGLVAAAAWPWVRDDQPDYVAIVCAVVLAVMLVFVDLWTGEAPFLVGMPGQPDVERFVPRIRLLWGPVTLAVAVLVLGLVVALDGPAWLPAACVAVALAVAALTCRPAVANFSNRRRITRAITAYAPDMVMAYAGRSGAPSQLRMWEPYLLRSGLKCLVINVRSKYAQLIIDNGHLESPFLQLGSDVDKQLDAFLQPSVKAIFYVQNAKSNSLFMRRKQFTHVWIHHGDTDKPGNFNERHTLYDKLVVAGPAAIDRYERHGVYIEPSKFEVIGRPQNAEIQRPRKPISEIKNPNVLYAPTWQGLDDEADFSSLANGPRIVRALLDRGATVTFRSHPLSKRWHDKRVIIREISQMLREDRAATGRKHLWGRAAEKDRTVADVTNRSDALISDLCGVASDYLMSTKPYAISSMRDSIEDFREKYFFTRTAYVLERDLSNIDEVLDDLLGADPFAAERHKSKEYVLGTNEGQELLDAFTNFVLRTVGRPETAGVRE